MIPYKRNLFCNVQIEILPIAIVVAGQTTTLKETELATMRKTLIKGTPHCIQCLRL